MSTPNELTSQREVAEFVSNPPTTYFAYVKLDSRLGTSDDRYGDITTWMGDKLGGIFWLGREYHDNLGGRRQNLRVRGINGRAYFGTYFKSAGDYCRLKLAK